MDIVGELQAEIEYATGCIRAGLTYTPSRDLPELLTESRREIQRLRTAGTVALQQMCRAVAPDNAYTDAVDQLDAVLNTTT